jgi:hypothetical protein
MTMTSEFAMGIVVAIPVVIAATFLAWESGLLGENNVSIQDARRRVRQRTIRSAVWGAVIASVIATVITLGIASPRVHDPAWASRLSSEQIRSVGLWIGPPVSALGGAICGVALSRLKNR